MNTSYERAQFLAALDLKYSATFVPWSQSRNATEKHPSLNWRVTIRRDTASLTADYMQGCAHIPGYMHQFSRLAAYDGAVRDACETGKSKLVTRKNGYEAAQVDRTVPTSRIIPAPELEEVLYSLVLDSDVLNFSTFEEWASAFGYDKDSRKAESSWRACLEIALKMRALLGDENLTKLRELFQDC